MLTIRDIIRELARHVLLRICTDLNHEGVTRLLLTDVDIWYRRAAHQHASCATEKALGVMTTFQAQRLNIRDHVRRMHLRERVRHARDTIYALHQLAMTVTGMRGAQQTWVIIALEPLLKQVQGLPPVRSAPVPGTAETQPAPSYMAMTRAVESIREQVSLQSRAQPR